MTISSVQKSISYLCFREKGTNIDIDNITHMFKK